jgi:5-formyltetrahydrofolate cyclo-ligase
VDINGPALESLARSARRLIRGRMQALRLAVPPAARARRASSIIERLLGLDEVVSARAIALFAPMGEKGEIDLGTLDAEARARGKRVYYPRLSPVSGAPVVPPSASGVMGMERLASLDGDLAEAPLTELVPSGRGFLAPPPQAKGAARGDVDVIVVPALAVSELGHRLGYGSGFYDRILPAYRPPARAIAVAFDFQFVAELPVLEGDVACDLVVTDGRVLRVTQAP